MYTRTHIKRFLLLAVTSVLLFSACKKSSSSPSVAGKWYLKSDLDVTNDNGNVSTNAISYSGKTTIVLNSNGTYVITPDVTSTADVTVYGTTPTNGTWSVNGTTITVDGTDMTIKTLTSNTFVTYFKESYTTSSGTTYTNERTTTFTR